MEIYYNIMRGGRGADFVIERHVHRIMFFLPCFLLQKGEAFCLLNLFPLNNDMNPGQLCIRFIFVLSHDGVLQLKQGNQKTTFCFCSIVHCEEERGKELSLDRKY